MFDSFQMQKRELRPHQTKAIEDLRAQFAQGKRRIVLQAPTGFGKTLTAAKIIESALTKGKRVLFTVPRLSLVGQAIEDFEREGIRHIGAMQANHPRTDASAPVQVATVHTLSNRLKDTRPHELVIVDECHEDHKVIGEMMGRWIGSSFIGLSATPWRQGMGIQWHGLVQAATIGSLIDTGYLSKFTVFAPDVPDLSGVRIRAGEYQEEGLKAIMGEAKLVANVVHTWLAKGEDRPTLVFGIDRAHAYMLQQQFIQAGVSAGYVDCETDLVERAYLARQFRAGEVRVACSVRTLTTGIDWPVSCIVDAAPTRSEMLHVQKIGRGLRINPGTEDCLILDHAGNSLRLGLVTDINYDELDKTPKGEKPKEVRVKLPKPCEACGALHTQMKCPECGTERKAPSGYVETAEGELVEFGASKKAPTKAEKQAFWSMALWLDDDRMKGGRLAKGLYKGKFGVWPVGLIDARKRPDQAFWNYEKASRIRYAKRMEKEKLGLNNASMARQHNAGGEG